MAGANGAVAAPSFSDVVPEDPLPGLGRSSPHGRNSSDHDALFCALSARFGFQKRVGGCTTGTSGAETDALVAVGLAPGARWGFCSCSGSTASGRSPGGNTHSSDGPEAIIGIHWPCRWIDRSFLGRTCTSRHAVRCFTYFGFRTRVLGVRRLHVTRCCTLSVME